MVVLRIPVRDALLKKTGGERADAQQYPDRERSTGNITHAATWHPGGASRRLGCAAPLRALRRGAVAGRQGGNRSEDGGDGTDARTPHLRLVGAAAAALLLHVGMIFPRCACSECRGQATIISDASNPCADHFTCNTAVQWLCYGIGFGQTLMLFAPREDPA